MTGVSYKDVAVPVLIGVTSFPYPSEVNGGSDRLRVKRAKKTARFPYPREVFEVSYSNCT